MTTPTSQGAVMDPDGMDLLNFSSDEEDNGPSSFSSDEINNGFAVMNQTNLPVTGDTPAVADGIGLPVSATEMENNEPAVFPLPPGFNLMELAIDSIDPTLEPPALDGIDPAALILEPPHQEEAAVNLVPNNLQPLNFSMNFPFGPAGTGFGPINTALQLNQPLLNMPPLADNMPFLRGDMPLLADNMPLLRGDLPPVQPEEGAAMMGAESSGMALFAAPGGEEMPALKNRDDTQQDLESTGGDAVNEQQSFTAFIWELVAMYVIGDAADICEGKSFYKDFVYEILERAQSRTDCDDRFSSLLNEMGDDLYLAHDTLLVQAIAEALVKKDYYEVFAELHRIQCQPASHPSAERMMASQEANLAKFDMRAIRGLPYEGCRLRMITTLALEIARLRDSQADADKSSGGPKPGHTREPSDHTGRAKKSGSKKTDTKSETKLKATAKAKGRSGNRGQGRGRVQKNTSENTGTGTGTSKGSGKAQRQARRKNMKSMTKQFESLSTQDQAGKGEDEWL